MIRFSAAIVLGLMVLFGIQIRPAASDDDRKAETRPDVYHAWWLASLTNPDEPKNGYYRLLITRGPLVPLSGQKQKDRRLAASALDAMAFTFLTYKKDSFYSHSG